MEERNVLSPEETDAIIEAAKKAGANAGAIGEQDDVAHGNINIQSLHNILEHIRAGIENKLTLLLRKKITVKSKPPVATKVEECLKQVDENHIYSSFKLVSHQSIAITCVDHLFLDMAISMLYGGKMHPPSSGPAPVGKIGLITAEKISMSLFDCLVDASKEYGEITGERYKTSHILQHITNLSGQEAVQLIELDVVFEELETQLFLYLPEEFLAKLIPIKVNRGQPLEKDFWRSAIKTEVIDSYVEVNISTSDVRMKLSEFMELKEGDELPIPDPTKVYVCLNDLKLFKALAGQSNSKVVAKVVSQV